MKRLCVLFAAMLLTACQDHSLTGVESRATRPGDAGQVALNVSAQSARLAIDDVVDRIVPTLRNASAARQIEFALKCVRQALQAGNNADRAALLSAARDAVQRYANLGNEDAPDVDVIRQVLEVARIQQP